MITYIDFSGPFKQLLSNLFTKMYNFLVFIPDLIVIFIFFKSPSLFSIPYILNIALYIFISLYEEFFFPLANNILILIIKNFLFILLSNKNVFTQPMTLNLNYILYHTFYLSMIMILCRLLLTKIFLLKEAVQNKSLRILFVGNAVEFIKYKILNDISHNNIIIGYLSTDKNHFISKGCFGSIKNINKINQKFDQIVCTSKKSIQQIYSQEMSILKPIKLFGNKPLNCNVICEIMETIIQLPEPHIIDKKILIFCDELTLISNFLSIFQKIKLKVYIVTSNNTIYENLKKENYCEVNYLQYFVLSEAKKNYDIVLDLIILREDNFKTNRLVFKEIKKLSIRNTKILSLIHESFYFVDLALNLYKELFISRLNLQNPNSAFNIRIGNIKENISQETDNIINKTNKNLNQKTFTLSSKNIANIFFYIMNYNFKNIKKPIIGLNNINYFYTQYLFNKFPEINNFQFICLNPDKIPIITLDKYLCNFTHGIKYNNNINQLIDKFISEQSISLEEIALIFK